MLASKIIRGLMNKGYMAVDVMRWAGNWATLRHLIHAKTGLIDLRVRFQGATLELCVRGGTLDTQIAREVLCNDSIYRLPVKINPRVIFDVGANIGATALYYATVYPQAHIYCFEPLPENLELLRKNTACYSDRITVLPVGLGDHEGVFDYHRSNDPANLGGGTFFGVGCNPQRSIKLQVRTMASVCRELEIKSVDVFKLDAEGAELSALRGAPAGMVQQAQAVIGELHGIGDFELLQWLSHTHDVGIDKAFNRPCYPFVAIRQQAQPEAAVGLQMVA